MARPLGKVVRDRDVTSRDLSFKSVWKEPKTQGWTSKRPPRRCLDDRYRYIRSNGDSNSKEGVDYVLGESDVLEYYANVVAAAEIAQSTYGPLVEAAAVRTGESAAPAPQQASPRLAVIDRPRQDQPQPSTPLQRSRRPTPARRLLTSPVAQDTSAHPANPPLASPDLIATSPHIGDDEVESVEDGSASVGDHVDEDDTVLRRRT